MNDKNYATIALILILALLSIPILNTTSPVNARVSEAKTSEAVNNKVPIYYIGKDNTIIGSFKNIILNPSQGQGIGTYITIIDLRYISPQKALNRIRISLRNNNPFILIGSPNTVMELLTNTKTNTFPASVTLLDSGNNRTVRIPLDLVIYGYFQLPDGKTITITLIDPNNNPITMTHTIQEAYAEITSSLRTMNEPNTHSPQFPGYLQDTWMKNAEPISYEILSKQLNGKL